MAGMNSIEGGRWDNLLRKFFTIKERGVAPSLAPEIVPTIQVEPSDNPTFDFLRNTRLCGGRAQQGAVAANFSQIELRNPTGSETLVVVTRINTWSIADNSFGIRVGTNSAAGVPTGQGNRDLRWLSGNFGLIQRTVARILIDAVGAPLGFELWEMRALANVQVEFPEVIILPPGFSVFADIFTVNLLLNASFVWYERAVEAGEL